MRLLTAVDIVLLNGHKRKRKSVVLGVGEPCL